MGSVSLGFLSPSLIHSKSVMQLDYNLLIYLQPSNSPDCDGNARNAVSPNSISRPFLLLAFFVAWVLMDSRQVVGEAKSPNGLYALAQESAPRGLPRNGQGSRKPGNTHTVTTGDCEYSVVFPSQPKRSVGIDPSIGEYSKYEAVMTGTDGAYLRMECLPVSGEAIARLQSAEHQMQLATKYAEANGIQNAEYGFVREEQGLKITVRGSKTAGGVPITIGVTGYVGNRSLLFLYTIAPAAFYPTTPIAAFLASVGRAETSMRRESTSHSSYRRVELPHRIAIEIPAHWVELSTEARRNLRSAAQAIADNAGSNGDAPLNDTLLAVNSTPNPPGAIIRVSVMEPAPYTEAELRMVTRAELSQAREESLNAFRKLESSGGPKVIEMHDLRIERIGNRLAIVSSYIRAGTVPSVPT